MKVSPTVSRWLPVMFMAGLLAGTAVPGSSDITPGGTHVIRQGATFFDGSIAAASVGTLKLKIDHPNGRVVYLQSGNDKYPGDGYHQR